MISEDAMTGTPIFEWEIDTAGDDVTVRLQGAAGVGQERDLAQCFQAIDKHQKSLVVIDLSQLTFISSLAMGALIALNKSLESRQGQLRLINLNPSIFAAFKAAALHRVLDIVGSMQ